MAGPRSVAFWGFELIRRLDFCDDQQRRGTGARSSLSRVRLVMPVMRGSSGCDNQGDDCRSYVDLHPVRVVVFAGCYREACSVANIGLGRIRA